MPLARKWLFHERGHESWLAQNVIREHATREDIPLLRAAIAKGLEDDEENVYRRCNLVEAFSNLKNIGVVQELCEVFAEFRYSYGRNLAAKAICTTSPEYFSKNYAFECLWDCESGTRELGAERVEISDKLVRGRLEELASDVLEEEDVREATGERIRKHG